jgi:hypothetical protein
VHDVDDYYGKLQMSVAHHPIRLASISALRAYMGKQPTRAGEGGLYICMSLEDVGGVYTMHVLFSVNDADCVPANTRRTMWCVGWASPERSHASCTFTMDVTIPCVGREYGKLADGDMFPPLRVIQHEAEDQRGFISDSDPDIDVDEVIRAYNAGAAAFFPVTPPAHDVIDLLDRKMRFASCQTQALVRARALSLRQAPGGGE